MATANGKRATMFAMVVGVLVTLVGGQIVNRPPHFVPGSGDMARFSLSENTPVDSPVYQLKGEGYGCVLFFMSVFGCDGTSTEANNRTMMKLIPRCRNWQVPIV